MMDYIREKNVILIFIFFIFLVTVIMSTNTMEHRFSNYLEHTKKIEFGMLEIRMSQYKKVLKRERRDKGQLKNDLVELLK